MSELVVLLKDPPLTGDAHTDNQRLRRGEVIDVLPDGWEFTARERSRPDWLILRVPDLSVEKAQQYTAAEPENERGGFAVIRHPRRRLLYLNLDGLTGDTLTADELEARTVRKPPPEDPDVLG